MRQKISYDSSDYTGVWFWIILLCLVFCCFFWWTPSYDYNDTVNTVNNVATTSSGYGWAWTWGWIIIGILFLWWIFALCFTPLDVYADDDEVRIRRPFKTKRIKMNEIESVQPYDAANAEGKKAVMSSPVRAFGKWGKYRDNKIGDYFAYYGKPDNTVLITLKNGKKYVVGGSNAQELSDYISSKLS